MARPMTMDEITALIGAMGASDLAELEVSKDGWTLRLRRAPVADQPDAGPVRRDASPSARLRPATPTARERAAVPASNDVRAPLSGMVYLSASPGAPPFVSPGERVEAGALLCTVEAMKTFNEVRAERAGTVEAVLVASGDEVDAGQPLVRLG